jgi:hypothetical protein
MVMAMAEDWSTVLLMYIQSETVHNYCPISLLAEAGE